MDTPSDEPQLPASLRWLKGLVMVLTTVMIVGMVLLVGTLFVKMRSAAAPPLPEHITLPEGAQASAVTVGKGWYGVVTTDGRLLVFDRATGALRQTIMIETD